MKNRLIAVAAALASIAVIAWAQDARTFGAAAVQAPQTTLVVKGEAALSDGTATILLPSWFESQAQAAGRVVILTPKNGFSPLSTSAVANGQFTVSTNETGEPTQGFYWVVLANKVQ